MRHRKLRTKLGKPADQRKALIRNILNALIRYERVKTTYKRAKLVSARADKLVTLGKKGDLSSRRQAYRLLQDRKLVKKLFDDIAARFKDITGGYTRVVKIENRRGDSAVLALLEFTKIKHEIIEEKKKLRQRRKERREKKLKEEEVAEVEEVKVEEEKKKEVQKPKPEVKATKKGFLGGLKSFLKRKREE